MDGYNTLLSLESKWPVASDGIQLKLHLRGSKYCWCCFKMRKKVKLVEQFKSVYFIYYYFLFLLIYNNQKYG